jgi:4-hydroxy-tetrahydrodipicolinate reductase
VTPRRVALIGTGRMGTAVETLAVAAGWEVCAAVSRDFTGAQLAGADVAIEFTTPQSAVTNILACLDAECPVVVGTTGWYDHLMDVEAAVEEAGGAVFWAPNFSIGANALMLLAAHARQLLPPDRFPAAVMETHHATKRDAPSGTALELAKGLEPGALISSLRIGHVPGTHELVFDGNYEQLRLEHVVRDRRVFAEGALAAADWLIGRQGMFTMRDLLEGKS